MASRREKPSRAAWPVAAAEFARCPRGSSTVRLSSGRDARGLFLVASCACCPAQRFRREER